MTSARIRSQEGFTLIELLAGMAVAMIVLVASFALLDSSVRLTATTQARVDASSRARLALDTMTRELRSQVCLDKAEPIVSAGWSGNVQSVTFYADFSDGSGTIPPQRRTLAYDSSAGTITESVWDGSGTPPATTYNSPPRVSVLLSDVAPDPDTPVDGSGGRPVFQFYKFDASPTPMWMGPLALPLSNADRSAVTKVSLAFGVRRQDAPAGEEPITVLRDDIFVRSADPNLTSSVPTCA